MNEITIKLAGSTLKLLEKITEHHNKEIGIEVSLEETLNEMILAHYLTEVAINKKEDTTKQFSITVTI